MAPTLLNNPYTRAKVRFYQVLSGNPTLSWTLLACRAGGLCLFLCSCLLGILAEFPHVLGDRDKRAAFASIQSTVFFVVYTVCWVVRRTIMERANFWPTSIQHKIIPFSLSERFVTIERFLSPFVTTGGDTYKPSNHREILPLGGILSPPFGVNQNCGIMPNISKHIYYYKNSLLYARETSIP